MTNRTLTLLVLFYFLSSALMPGISLAGSFPSISKAMKAPIEGSEKITKATYQGTKMFNQACITTMINTNKWTTMGTQKLTQASLDGTKNINKGTMLLNNPSWDSLKNLSNDAYNKDRENAVKVKSDTLKNYHDDNGKSNIKTDSLKTGNYR